MIEKGFELTEDGDKYYILIDLYNNWHKKSCFLSVGNTKMAEWDALLDYCKDNPKETAHFYLDLIDCYNQSKIEGRRADDFVGFFNDIIYETFKEDEEFPIFSESVWVHGSLIQALYKTYITVYLGEEGTKNWWNKLKDNLLKKKDEKI